MNNQIKKEENIENIAKTIKRRLDGVVVSDKMDKTITVSVNSVKIHPRYRKRYTVTNKYKAHDEKNVAKVDDKVTIESCRPISKDKKWRLASINK